MAAAAPCQPVSRMPVAGRTSAYDSAMVPLGDAAVKVCYGRPSARNRTVFGGAGAVVRYDTLWRTGANEPTILHVPVPARIAGLAVEPGSYSLYTVPRSAEWTVIVNRSTSQWGHESQYTAAVRAQEVGRANVPAGRTTTPVETFTVRGEPAGGGRANLVLEWADTQLRIPVERR